MSAQKICCRCLLITFLFTGILSGTEMFAQDSLVVPLWTKGAPGFENKKNEIELAKEWWVKNIHNPSITVYLPPKEKANGTAVLICPGGGHRALGFNGEGVAPAKYLNSLGIAAFVLKYRLFREENSPYNETHAKQDGIRAMRLIRSRGKEWNIDTAKLGIMGFSAGGETVAWVCFDSTNMDFKANDPIDKLSYKPAFQILIYPGPLGIPVHIPSNAPPAFLLVANADQCCSAPVVELLTKYREAKVPVEAHIYSVGDHAFNMGTRSSFASLKGWTGRLTDWLNDNGWMRGLNRDSK